MNLTEWAEMQGIHKTTAYRWYRDGVLPVPARKAGLDRQAARLAAWAARNGLAVVKVVTESAPG